MLRTLMLLIQRPGWIQGDLIIAMHEYQGGIQLIDLDGDVAHAWAWSDEGSKRRREDERGLTFLPGPRPETPAKRLRAVLLHELERS